MNICIFSSTIDKKGGGPSRSVPILAKGLSSLGITTLLLTSLSDDMNSHILENSKVNLVVLPVNAKDKDIERIIVDNKVNILHLQGVWLPIYSKVCKIARKLDIPYIITPRGALEPWCLRSVNVWKRYKKRLAMLMYQKNDLQKSAMLLATSKMEADNLRALGLTRPIAIIPNGIIMDDYPCRGAESLDQVKKQIIFLSRIVPKKGVDYLLDSWKKVITEFPDWNLIIVGNGERDYISHLNQIIIETGLDNSVKILQPAFGRDKYLLYSESSLFVLPTHSENFGMVIAEALACGLPVITTTGTPWKSLVESKSGWWIDLSTDNLTGALREAMRLPKEELFEMGQRGAKMVRESYDYVQVSKRMVEAYNWLLKSNCVPEFVEL